MTKRNIKKMKDNKKEKRKSVGKELEDEGRKDWK